jgi:hypothetical protein
MNILYDIWGRQLVKCTCILYICTIRLYVSSIEMPIAAGTHPQNVRIRWESIHCYKYCFIDYDCDSAPVYSRCMHSLSDGLSK